MTDMILYINNSLIESEIGMSGVEWIAVDPQYDTFIFSNGGSGVVDGDDTPTDIELNRSAVQLSESSSVIVPKYFLLDYSADLLREIKLAGNQAKRFAFCCSFDGATATEPQLEAWDNSDMNTYIDAGLGNGSPSASWYKGICTTTDTPDPNWTGINLAGSDFSNVILLNDGVGGLNTADDLYFNFKIVIPAGYLTPAIHTPVLVVTYTTN